MKLTNFQLDQVIKPALKELANKEMPVSVAFRVRKVLKAVDQELTTLTEMTREILQKHGQCDKADEEYRELLSQVIEFDPPKIKLEDLEALDTISPATLITLEPFIDEE